jgi:hypothetical protein
MQAEIKYFADARKGPSRYFKNLRFFACEGLICIIDERPSRTIQNGKYVEEGDCQVLTPKDFEKRIKAITRLYRNKNYSEMLKWQGLERKKYHLQAREGYEAVKEAREMGDPSDPAVQAYWAKHKGKNYVSFAGVSPDLSKIADTRGAALDTAVVGKTKPVPVQKVLPPMLHLPTPKQSKIIT